MTHQTRARRALRCAAATWTGPGQRTTAIGLLVVVVVVDRTTPWWAWRNDSGAIIDAGSTWPIGRPVSGWFSGLVTGAVLDLLGVGPLSLAGHLLVRRRRRQAVLVAGARMIGGWGSNLLDRLGLHRATAPGSARGAVDPAPNGVPVVVVGGAAAIAASHDVGVDSSPRPPAETAGHV
ncbi:MAG: hypothetical protein JWR28_237 [Modestobacter sp.]|jgi:hypothetical protein|nr:hypothetical protein [Modestobacter sp.]